MAKLLVSLLVATSLIAADWPQGAADALNTFRSGDYQSAIPLLKAAKFPKEQDAFMRSTLLSALVYQEQVDEASGLADALAAQYPSVPEVMTARAELLYYLGDPVAADKLFRAALQLNGQLARAHLGLYRILHAASYYRSARMSCLRAHALDPDDALITLAFMRYLAPQRLSQEFGPFLATHPWFARNFQQNQENAGEIRNELAGHKAFELEGERRATTLHLSELLQSQRGRNQVRGFGIEVAIEGGRPLRMLLDTGASGILIRQQAADKAGLKHVGSTQAWGVGDGGTRKGFAAIATTCTVGQLSYKNCVFGSLEGKGRIAGDEDGLIGTDFFADYLIHIDFARHLMDLKPLPARPAIPQGYDRTISPEEADFTPVFRFGHSLMIPTRVNGKSSGLFLLDTGASLSNIDSTFARNSTKIHGDDYTVVRGVSGKVANIFEADKAELEFGHFRQRNLGLTAFNLNNWPYHQEVRTAGILGLPVLTMFRLDLDYRNGLVKLDYALK